MIPRRSRHPRALDCRAVGKLLQAYLDGEIDDTRAVLTADHLDACRRCGLEAESYRRLIGSLNGLGGPDDEQRLSRLRSFAEALATQS